jgi:PIN domain nuclease of toxin-antitoxin system
MPAVLDTHAAIWYLLDTKNLSETVFSLIDGAAASGVPTYISAVSLVEVVYLVERGRIATDAFERFVRELSQDNPAFKVFPLDYNVASVLRSKLKMKLTLSTLRTSPVLGAFSTAKRLPSGCRSKFEENPRLVNWPGDQSHSLSAWKESAEAL